MQMTYTSFLMMRAVAAALSQPCPGVASIQPCYDLPARSCIVSSCSVDTLYRNIHIYIYIYAQYIYFIPVHNAFSQSE